jgi:hypothetical protein
MKIGAALVITVLALSWLSPVAVAQGSPQQLPAGDVNHRGETVSPDVIGIVTVLGAYAILWAGFALALKIRALLDDEEEGAGSEAASAPLGA